MAVGGFGLVAVVCAVLVVPLAVVWTGARLSPAGARPR
jgi:hypothetical protein